MIGDFLTSAEAMNLALQEARKGFAHVSPNPQVGCVILSAAGRLLSVGHHEKYGGPHAEVQALRSLSEGDLKGAQVFVTLEPCAHQGQTPSCAKTLAELPISRVVYGLEDPNPLVRGQGAAILKNAGIHCELYQAVSGDHLQSDLEEIAEAFLWNFRHRKVFVSLKVASSLDSQTAMASGESKWITGPLAREEVHRLRAAHDAVMVGSGTVLADDPTLDIRHPSIIKQNTAIILDPTGRLRERRQTLKLASRSGKTLWIENEKDPTKILGRLWDEGIRSVMIEGGAQIASAFLSENLVNRLYLFRAPILLGHQGRSWTEFLTLGQMSEKREISALKQQFFGPDLLVTGLLRDPLTGELQRTI